MAITFWYQEDIIVINTMAVWTEKQVSKKKKKSRSSADWKQKGLRTFLFYLLCHFHHHMSRIPNQKGIGIIIAQVDLKNKVAQNFI